MESGMVLVSLRRSGDPSSPPPRPFQAPLQLFQGPPLQPFQGPSRPRSTVTGVPRGRPKWSLAVWVGDGFSWLGF